MRTLFKNKYGYFDEERGEYVITSPDTPRPWSNIISNGTYGFTITQNGSGYSFRDHAQFNRLTRWDQDLTRDNWGKYVFIRDEASGRFWSPTPKPTNVPLKNYECRHGTGYTGISGEHQGIRSSMLYFADVKSPVEVWSLTLTNNTSKTSRLSLFTYLEWCLGTSPDWHREFDKIFVETKFDKKAGAVFANKSRWGIPAPDKRPWARPYEFTGFHASIPAPVAFESDQSNFMGQNGELTAPAAVRQGRLKNTQGRWTDGITSIQTRVVLRPGQTRTVVYLLGATRTANEARAIINRYAKKGQVELELAKVKKLWKSMLGNYKTETPDDSLNLLANQWLPYQAISCRMWGRTAYYQTGGAYGFRDQLQDSLATLPINPDLCREHIGRAARHQFSDGSTFHWWHPITEEGARKKNSDDLLWLPFVTIQYLKESGDLSFLKERVPFFDKGSATIREHCKAAIEQVLARPSPRGIPTMVEGDWNDGLSCIGFDGTSESIWLAEFLYGILTEWNELLAVLGDAASLKDLARYEKKAAQLKNAINKYAWDGDWYIRATYAHGKLGSKSCKIGKVWLNSQTWALMYGIPSPDRKKRMLAALQKYLYRDYGPLLFYPAFRTPDPGIGHLSQYAPGMRENGGLYTHAGCWAIIAEAIAGTPERAYKVFTSFNPIQRGKNPDHYLAEPYVTPGNVDGPESPRYGRGGWTWYTGSASWMFRGITDYILGIRATFNGLRIKPAVPGSWRKYSVVRKFRGATYRIRVIRAGKADRVAIKVNGVSIRGDILPAAPKGSRVDVEVRLG